MAYVNFNDERIPLGKRKQAYVRWAISKGTDKIAACRQANEKFGFVKKGKVLIVIKDYGRSHQNSYRPSEIYEDVDTRKLEDVQYIFWDWASEHSSVRVYSSYGFSIDRTLANNEDGESVGVPELIKKEIAAFEEKGYKIKYEEWAP